MHLGPKIFGVELAFLLAWQYGYSLDYTLYYIGAINADG